jgi:hypothetical protein
MPKLAPEWASKILFGPGVTVLIRQKSASAGISSNKAAFIVLFQKK